MMRMVTRNFGWKVTSLAVSFLVWLSLSGSRESTTSITAPVQYRNIPKSLQISSEMVESVHFVLRGPSLTLSRLSSQPFPLIIDLSNVRGPGESTFTISRENADLPEAIMLERAIPSQVRLTLETRVARAVPVKVLYSNIPQGMQVNSASVIPASLTVIGPESRVAGISEVVTDPVDLRMLDAEGEARTTCYAGDPQVNFTSSPQVRVKVTIGPADPAPPETATPTPPVK
jgi:YbbR domain-containing protein